MHGLDQIKDFLIACIQIQKRYYLIQMAVHVRAVSIPRDINDHNDAIQPIIPSKPYKCTFQLSTFRLKLQLLFEGAYACTILLATHACVMIIPAALFLLVQLACLSLVTPYMHACCRSLDDNHYASICRDWSETPPLSSLPL